MCDNAEHIELIFTQWLITLHILWNVFLVHALQQFLPIFLMISHRYLLILLFCTKTIMLSLEGRAFRISADSAGNSCASWGQHSFQGDSISGLVHWLLSIFQDLPWSGEISKWWFNDCFLSDIRIIEHIRHLIKSSESPSTSFKFRSTLVCCIFIPNIVNVEYSTLLLWFFFWL